MAIDLTLTATIICSWGGRFDTSYISMEEADAMVATKYGMKDTWDSIDEDKRIAALLSATRDIDGAMNWVGSKYFYNQNLEFPRAISISPNVSEPDEAYYNLITTSQEQIEMYRHVKFACLEQAVWITRLGGVDTHAENKARGLASVSEGYGSVNESYSYRGGVNDSKLCPEARKLLRSYVSKPKLLRG